ncbi:hypothetical protein PO070_01100, partial [Bacteroides stercoris]|uniref:hypothetical protein n=1 Tax=Bacteroides stercoris TaxID=46506 RepID=UPI00232E61E2
AMFFPKMPQPPVMTITLSLMSNKFFMIYVFSYTDVYSLGLYGKDMELILLLLLEKSQNLYNLYQVMGLE